MTGKGLTIGAGAVAIAMLAAGGAQAQTGAEFFKGKTVTYIVATDAGGGYDTYGRLIARYMQKYLPGSRFIVKNMPGGGHIIGANTIYAARPDGTTIGMFDTALTYAQLIAREGVKFDLRKMSYIGKSAHELRVVLVGTTAPGIEAVRDYALAYGPP